VMEGRMMSMIVSRAPGWEPPKKQTSLVEKQPAKDTSQAAPTNTTQQNDERDASEDELVGQLVIDNKDVL